MVSNLSSRRRRLNLATPRVKSFDTRRRAFAPLRCACADACYRCRAFPTLLFLSPTPRALIPRCPHSSSSGSRPLGPCCSQVLAFVGALAAARSANFPAGCTRVAPMRFCRQRALQQFVMSAQRNATVSSTDASGERATSRANHMRASYPTVMGSPERSCSSGLSPRRWPSFKKRQRQFLAR